MLTDYRPPLNVRRLDCGVVFGREHCASIPIDFGVLVRVEFRHSSAARENSVNRYMYEIKLAFAPLGGRKVIRFLCVVKVPRLTFGRGMIHNHSSGRHARGHKWRRQLEQNDMTDSNRVDSSEAVPHGDNPHTRLERVTVEAPNRQMSIAERTNSTLDIATAEISQNIRGLINELEELDTAVISDAAQVKQRIRDHIDLGNAAQELTKSVRTEMTRLVKLRQELANAKVR